MSSLLITQLTASSQKNVTHVASNHKYLLVLILVPFPVFSFSRLAAGLFLLRRSTLEAACMADEPNTAVEDDGLSASCFKSMESENRSKDGTSEDHSEHHSKLLYEINQCIRIDYWHLPLEESLVDWIHLIIDWLLYNNLTNIREITHLIIQSKFNDKYGRVVSQRRLTKTQTWVTVKTGVSPSFRVGVSFRAILLCLILNRILVAY